MDIERSIKLDDGASLQYESLRSKVLENDEEHRQGSLGLALFIRQGMLAWRNVCHKYSSSKSSDQVNKTVGASKLPYKVQSEMTKVLANITLFNLKEVW